MSDSSHFDQNQPLQVKAHFIGKEISKSITPYLIQTDPIAYPCLLYRSTRSIPIKRYKITSRNSSCDYQLLVMTAHTLEHNELARSNQAFNAGTDRAGQRVGFSISCPKSDIIW